MAVFTKETVSLVDQAVVVEPTTLMVAQALPVGLEFLVKETVVETVGVLPQMVLPVVVVAQEPPVHKAQSLLVVRVV